jgi:hypothetical protein
MNKSKDAAAGQIVSRSEFARLIGRSRARVSQLCQGEMAGVLSNGRIDVEAALQWLRQYASSHPGGWGSGTRANDRRDIAVGAARTAPAAPKLKAVPASRPRRSVANAPVATDEQLAEAWREGYLQAAREVAATKEVVRFAQFAIRAGCTPAQAFHLGTWFACQICLSLSGIEEGDGIFEILEPSWRHILGLSEEELDHLGEEFDRLNAIDVTAEDSPEHAARERELDALCSRGPDERPAA